MAKKLTQEKIARIHLLKQKGYSKVKVGRMVGVSEGTDKPVVMQGLVLDKIVRVREATKITDLMIANEKKEKTK